MHNEFSCELVPDLYKPSLCSLPLLFFSLSLSLSLSLSSQMDKTTASKLLAELNGIYAYFVVIKSASAAGSFSQLPGSIVFEEPSVRIPARKLFTSNILDILKCDDTCNRHQRAAVRRLKQVLEDQTTVSELATTLSSEPTERLQFPVIANLILKRLVPRMCVNAESYSTETLCDKGITINREYLGMGSNLTWHGTSDGRADWTSLQFIRKREFLERDSDSDSSSGGKTVCEAKQKLLSPKQCDQMLAQCVVSSHIHHNRHPLQNPLIPSLGISGVDGKMMAYLYDSFNDVMFRLEPVYWLNIDTDSLVRKGILLIWLICFIINCFSGGCTLIVVTQRATSTTFLIEQVL